MMFRRRIASFVVAASALLPVAGDAITFNTTLSAIRINARPGQVVTRPFELTLAPGERRTVFNVHAEDWWRSEDGKQSFYAPPGRIRNSCASWVTVNPVEEAVEPGGTLHVRVTAAVPPEARPGGYWCALTLDEVLDPLTVVSSSDSAAVQFLASISVGIYIYIDPIERAGEILDVQVENDEARVRLRNTGNTPLTVEGRFEFLRGEGVAAVPVAQAAIPRSTVLTEPAPTSIIAATLPRRNDLPSGRYLVRAIVDFGLDHYVGVEKEIEITRESSDGGTR